jgi:hypothetical protein
MLPMWPCSDLTEAMPQDIQHCFSRNLTHLDVVASVTPLFERRMVSPTHFSPASATILLSQIAFDDYTILAEFLGVFGCFSTPSWQNQKLNVGA